MEVILQEDYPSLGYIGDSVQVKPGYGRNFLLPRGIAIEATGRNRKMLNHKMARILAKRAKLKVDAEVQAEKLSTEVLTFTLKFARSGRSFGSIGARDVQVALADKGYEIDRRRIRLSDSIKAAGQFTVDVNLHAEVMVPVKVEIKAERVEEPKAEGTKRSKKGASASQDGAEESLDAAQEQDMDSTEVQSPDVDTEE